MKELESTVLGRQYALCWARRYGAVSSTICVALTLLGIACVLSGCGTDVGAIPASDSQQMSESSDANEPEQQIPDNVHSDVDEDGVPDHSDQCSASPRREPVDGAGCAASQRDSDGDSFSDGDEVNFIAGTDPFDPTDNPNNVRDTDGDGCSDFDEANFEGFCDNDPDTPALDEDADGVPDESDNCVSVANPDQPDTDTDGFGDACDLCPGGDDRFDFDADGVPEDCDVCPLTFDPAQVDSDGDGVGDACELFLDFDGDGIEDSADNCILFPNPGQADSDGDGVGDACEAVLPPPVLVETVIVADDGQFLGVISDNSFDLDSIANRFGTYGNQFSSLSIWNEFGTYGSAFSLLSPWNDFTTSPPVILEGDLFVARLTTNGFLAPRIDPNDLAIIVGRAEETRP